MPEKVNKDGYLKSKHIKKVLCLTQRRVDYLSRALDVGHAPVDKHRKYPLIGSPDRYFTMEDFRKIIIHLYKGVARKDLSFDCPFCRREVHLSLIELLKEQLRYKDKK